MGSGRPKSQQEFTIRISEHIMIIILVTPPYLKKLPKKEQVERII
jgi:hypothetical protein